MPPSYLDQIDPLVNRVSVLDRLSQGQQVDPQERDAVDQASAASMGEFEKGLRRFGYSSLATTKAFAGQMAETVAPEFSQQQFAKANETLRSMPASLQAETPTFEQAQETGDYGSWATGKLGEGLASTALMVGAGLLTKGASLRAAPAVSRALQYGTGAATMLPMEGGETALDLHNDPVAMANTTAAERTAMTLGRGGVNALAENVVPYFALTKPLAGAASAIAPGLRSAASNLGRKTLAGATGEYATEYAQDLTGQFVHNQAVPGVGYDLKQANEAGLAGAVSGSVMGGAGSLAQAGWSNARAGAEKVDETARAFGPKVLDAAVSSIYDVVNNPAAVAEDVTNMTIGAIAQAKTQIPEYARAVKGQIDKGIDVASEAIGEAENQFSRFILDNVSPENQGKYASLRTDLKNMTVNEYRAMRAALAADTQGNVPFLEAGYHARRAKSGASKIIDWTQEIRKGVAAARQQPAEGVAESVDIPQHKPEELDELAELFSVADPLLANKMAKADPEYKRATASLLSAFATNNPEEIPLHIKKGFTKETGGLHADKIRHTLNRLYTLYKADPTIRTRMNDVFEENDVPAAERVTLINLAGRDTPYKDLSPEDKMKLTKLGQRANQTTQDLMLPLIAGKPLAELTAADKKRMTSGVSTAKDRGRAYYEGVVLGRLTPVMDAGIKPEYIPPGAPKIGTGADTNRIMTNQETYDLMAGKERYFDDDTGEWAVRDIKEFNRPTPWNADLLRQSLRVDQYEVDPEVWKGMSPTHKVKKATTNPRTGEQMQNSVKVDLYSDVLPPAALAELIGKRPQAKKYESLSEQEAVERTQEGTFTTYINLESVGAVARHPANKDNFDAFLPEWSRDSGTNTRAKAQSMADKAMAAMANLGANGMEIDPNTLSPEFKAKYNITATDPITVYANVDMEPLTGEASNVLAGTEKVWGKTKRRTYAELGDNYGASGAQQLRTLNLFENNIQELKDIAALPVQNTKGLTGEDLKNTLGSNRQRISAQKLVNRIQGIMFGEKLEEAEAIQKLKADLQASAAKRTKKAVEQRINDDADILAEAVIDDGKLNVDDASGDVRLVEDYLETNMNTSDLVNMGPYDIDKLEGEKERAQLAEKIVEKLQYRREQEAKQRFIQTGAMEGEESTDWDGAATDFMNSLEMAERRLRESLANKVEQTGTTVTEQKAETRASIEAYMAPINAKFQQQYRRMLGKKFKEAATIPQLEGIKDAVDRLNKVIDDFNAKVKEGGLTQPLVSKELRTRFEKQVQKAIREKQAALEMTIGATIENATTVKQLEAINKRMKNRLTELPEKRRAVLRKQYKKKLQDIKDPAGIETRAAEAVRAKLTPAQKIFHDTIKTILGGRVAVLFDQQLATGVAAQYQESGESAESMLDKRTNLIKFLRTPKKQRDYEAFGFDPEITDKEIQKQADDLESLATAKMEDKTVQAVIRVASGMEDHAGVAEHEALHGAFRLLFEHRKEDRRILAAAFTAGQAGRRLRAHFKDAPEVLAKIDPNSKTFNAEEAAAYGFQVWATNPEVLKLNAPQEGIFEKIKALFRAVFNILTTEEKAAMLMKDLRNGMTAKTGITALQRYQDRDRSVADHVVEVPKALGGAVKYFVDTLLRSTYSRLMDTDNPALQQIARLGYLATGEDAGDSGTGMVQRMRLETTTRLNKLTKIFDELGEDGLKKLHEDHILRADERTEDDAIDKFFQEMRDYQIKAGVVLNNAGPRYYPLPWDPQKVLNDRAGFIAMLDKYRAEFAEMNNKGDLAITPAQIWENIADYGERGELLTDVTAQNDEPVAGHTKTRFLAFISPEDRRAFMSDDPAEVMFHYAQQAVRNAEFVRAYGKSGSTLNQLIAQAKDTYGATSEEIALANDYMDGLLGNKGQGMSRELKDAYGAVTLYQNVRLLPFSAFSSLVDPLGIAIRTNDVGAAWGAFTYSMKNLFRDWKKEYTPDQWETLATDLGYIESSGTTTSTDARYTGITLTGKTRKWNDTFFKLNLLNGLVRNHHIMATKAADKFLLRASEGFFGEEKSARYLQELNIQPENIIYSEALQRNLISEQEFIDAGQDPDQAKKSAERMRQAMGTVVRQSLISPSSAEMPNWMSNPYLAPIAHLKSFVFGFNKTVIERLTHEARHGNSTPLLLAAAYVPGMIAADFLKDMVSNVGDVPEYKENWGAGDYLKQGVYRSGLTGAGQFFTDSGGDMSRGGTGIESFLGPSFEQIKDWHGVYATGSGEQFWSEIVDALPANAIYDQWIDP